MPPPPLLPQEDSMMPQMTTLEVLQLYSVLSDSLPASRARKMERAKRVEDVLGMMGLEKQANTLVCVWGGAPLHLGGGRGGEKHPHNLVWWGGALNRGGLGCLPACLLNGLPVKSAPSVHL